MKTSIKIAGAFVALAVMGLSAQAQATFSKYHEYRAMVEATQGTTAAEPMHAWKHLNRFARDIDEKSGLGEIVLPKGDEKSGPKNFRNNVTR